MSRKKRWRRRRKCCASKHYSIRTCRPLRPTLKCCRTLLIAVESDESSTSSVAMVRRSTCRHWWTASADRCVSTTNRLRGPDCWLNLLINCFRGLSQTRHIVRQTMKQKVLFYRLLVIVDWTLNPLTKVIRHWVNSRSDNGTRRRPNTCRPMLWPTATPRNRSALRCRQNSVSLPHSFIHSLHVWLKYSNRRFILVYSSEQNELTINLIWVSKNKIIMVDLNK